jgi:hypothetical protein
MERFSDDDALKVLREIQRLAGSVKDRELDERINPNRALAIGYIAGVAGRAVEGKFPW